MRHSSGMFCGCSVCLGNHQAVFAGASVLSYSYCYIQSTIGDSARCSIIIKTQCFGANLQDFSDAPCLSHFLCIQILNSLLNFMQISYKLSHQLSNKRHDSNLTDDIEFSCYRDLGLVVDRGPGSSDRLQLRKIIFKILKYPSIQLALLHQECDRIGTNDLDDPQEPNSYSYIDSSDTHCDCCGFRRQPQAVPFCVPLKNIRRLGTSTVLFFQSIQAATVMLFIASIVCSIFPIMLSLLDPSCGDFWCKLSTQTDWHRSKQFIHFKASNVEAFLSIILVVIWGFYFLFRRVKQKQAQYWEDLITVSASDFTIKITNLPSTVTKEYLQTLLDSYFLELGEMQIPSFEIVKLNIAEPFYMNKKTLNDPNLIHLMKKRDQKKKLFRQWIRDRINGNGMSFKTNFQQRTKHFKEYQEILNSLYALQKELTQKVAKQHIRDEEQTKDHTVFVTFKYSEANKIIARLNQSSLIDRIRAYIFSGGAQVPRLQLGQSEIMKAPQPEDIIWTNMGIPWIQRFKRRLLTVVLAGLMLCITFLLVFGLSVYKKNDTKTRIASLAISLLINLINPLIGFVVKILVNWQRHFTKIDYERSFSRKIIIIQTINMVLPVLLVDLTINHNISGHQGLADDVFSIAVMNIVASLILKIVYPRYSYKKWRQNYMKNPGRRLQTNQKTLNKIYEGMEFTTGAEYIFVIKTCVFTSFFLALVPAIAIVSSVGLILIYWVNKYNLLKRSKRPAPGTNIVHNSLIQFVYLCPLFYIIGAVIWSNFGARATHSSNISHTIAGVIGIIIFLIPYEGLSEIIFKSKQKNKTLPILTYQNCRRMFSSDYDLLNPATKHKAQIQYRQFLKMKSGSVKKSIISHQQKKRFHTNSSIDRKHDLGQQLEVDDIVEKVAENINVVIVELLSQIHI